MNWFKKISSPYASNICPHCTTSLLLDLYGEKGNNGKLIGKCSKCGGYFEANCLNSEEKMNFRWCILKPIGQKLYRLFKRRGHGEMLVVDD